MIKKLLCIILVVVCIVIVINLLAEAILIAVVEWIFAPSPISYSDDAEKMIAEYLGAQVPPDAKYLDGRLYGARDSTYIYIFELDLPEEIQKDSVDLYLRQQLNLDEDSCEQTCSTDDYNCMHGVKAEDMPYSFTHCIDHVESDWSEIHYCVNDSKLVFALICGT